MDEVMAITPRNIREHEFRVGPEGYDRNEVRSFFARVAEDYELALDGARASRAPTPDERAEVLDDVRMEADELIRQAEKEARGIRHEAAAHAAEIREQAAEESLHLKEAATDRAGHLLAEAQEGLAQVTKASGQARDEVVQMRSTSAEKATMTLDDAYDQAAALLETAAAKALGLIRESQAECQARLDEVSQQLSAFELHDERLRRRIAAMEEVVDKLLARTTSLTRTKTSNEGQGLVYPRK